MYTHDLLEATAPGAQREAIMNYTADRYRPMNTILRISKKYNNIIKNKEFKEKFINTHGIEKWNEFKSQLNDAYKYAHETQVTHLREWGSGSLKDIYYLRRVFENQS